MNRYTLDNANVQSNEKIFTSANVSNINRKWSRTVLGDVYAQTLYIDNVTIRSNTGQVYRGGVVIAATQRNFIYALNASNGTVLWSSNYSYKWQRDSSYTSSNISVTPDLDYLASQENVESYAQYRDIRPNIGITGTPVIDSVAGVLYFITSTSEKSTNPLFPTWFYSTLNKVSLSNGAHMPNSPRIIGGVKKSISRYWSDYYGTGFLEAINNNQRHFKSTDFVNGTPYVIINSNASNLLFNNGSAFISGYGDTIDHSSEQRVIFFNPQNQNQQTGLTLSRDRNNVYAGWGSFGNTGYSFGWMMGFNTTTLSNSGIFCSSLGGSGGISQGSTKFPIDSYNFIYTSTDNGIFFSHPAAGCFGNAILKLQHVGSNLNVLDFFTQFNVTNLNQQNLNVSTGGITIIPPSDSSYERVLGCYKNLKMILLDSIYLGSYNSNINDILSERFIPTDVDVNGSNQETFIAPSYFNNIAYITTGGNGGGGIISITVTSSNTLEYRTTSTDNITGNVGAPVIITSSNSTDINPLIWIASQVPIGDPLAQTGSGEGSKLFVYNNTLTTQHTQINLTSSSYSSFKLCKFHNPTIYNGRVILGGSDQVLMLGL